MRKSTPPVTRRSREAAHGRSRPFTRSRLALAVSAALVASPVAAQDGTASASLERLKVEESVTPDTNPYAVPGAPYLAGYSADPRRTRPLAETPQTITVITGTQIEESGRTDLKAILDMQPGITLGTGENGNAFGDRYIIRGHEARSDIFVDGLRDPGMTIRESFAVEQVEITKGPSSTFAGRGSTGGAVNSVTKRASTEFDFGDIQLGVGTDNHYRGTADVNRVLTADTAARVNLLFGDEDVPERDPADRSRRGLAGSLTHHFSDDLEVTLDYYHLDAEDSPDLGTYIENLGGGQYGSVHRDIPVYLQSGDFLDSEVHTGTVRLSYEVSPTVRLVNLSRYGVTDNGYIATGARGTTAYRSAADAMAGSNGFETATLSTHQGWQEVDYFGNQLNALVKSRIGGLDHEFVLGVGYTDHKVLNGTWDTTNTGATNCFTGNGNGAYCLSNPDGSTAANLDGLLGRTAMRDEFDSDWQVKTLSLSAMDTVDLTDAWTVFAGVRYDHYDYSNTAYFDPDGRGGPLPRALTTFEDDGGFWNGHLGVAWEIIHGATLYTSYSTSTNINGGESDLGTSCGYGGVCVDSSDPTLGDPERTHNLELGLKWLLNPQLLATVAAFRTTKNDVMEQPSGDSYSTIGSLNTGRNRIVGIEFGLTGNLTRKLSAQAGLTVMRAEVLSSLNQANVGKTLANFADKSAALHLKYQATPKFAFGGTMTYESARYTGQPDAAANENMKVPSYTVFDLFANYHFSRQLSAQANIGNVFDKDYYLAAYRSGAFTYIGDGRNARLTVKYEF